ncbi:PepSY domain-containing protein [Achromobacter insuavis]
MSIDAPRRLRIWRWLHTWSSLACTLFLLMLCLTGLPLIFHDEIDAWFDTPASAPPARRRPRHGTWMPWPRGCASNTRAVTSASSSGWTNLTSTVSGWLGRARPEALRAGRCARPRRHRRGLERERLAPRRADGPAIAAAHRHAAGHAGQPDPGRHGRAAAGIAGFRRGAVRRLHAQDAVRHRAQGARGCCACWTCTICWAWCCWSG